MKSKLSTSIYDRIFAFSRFFCRETKGVKRKYGKVFSSNQNCQQPKTAEPCVLTNFFSEKGIVTEYV